MTFSTPLRRPKACRVSSGRKPMNRVDTVVVGAVGVVAQHRDSPTVAVAVVVPVASYVVGCRHHCVGAGVGSRHDRDGGDAAVAAVRDDGGGSPT